MRPRLLERKLHARYLFGFQAPIRGSGGDSLLLTIGQAHLATFYAYSVCRGIYMGSYRVGGRIGS
jgi:hypothetical protein